MSAFEIFEKLRQGCFRFTLENVIGVGEFLDRAGDVWTTEYDHLTALFATLDHFVKRLLLGQHTGDEDHIGPLDLRVFQSLDV